MERTWLPAELLAFALEILLAEDAMYSRTYCVRSSVAGCTLLASFSRTCRRCHAVVAATGLWHSALRRVAWPMPAVIWARQRDGLGDPDLVAASQLKTLRRAGTATRELQINCLHVLPGDVSALVECCPSVEMLELCFFGPEGADGLSWSCAWQQKLTSLVLHFWYDDCLGAPRIAKVLADIGAHCQALREMRLTGLDWPRARADVCTALMHGYGRSWPNLCRLWVEGSEPWHAVELTALQVRGITVEARLLPDRTR